MKTIHIILVIVAFHIGYTITTAQCNNLHFRASSCFEETVISTLTPLNDGCEHWPAPVSVGEEPHIARYQNRLTINAPIGPDRTIQFSANEAESLMNWARAHWSLQCGTPRGLAWETTTNGGIFYWSTDATVIGGNTLGIGNSALNPNDLSIFVDASNCSPSSPRNISEIIFNNTEEFFSQNPQRRWTTTPNACDGTPFTCFDFQSVALHELGHYVGLAHDGSQTSVMAAGYRGRMVVFEMCDVDRFRRLYCLGSVGNPVSVNEQFSPEIINLGIFPNPSNSNYINIRFKLPKSELVHIFITDISGKELAWIANEFFESGYREIMFPVFDIPSGSYFVNLLLSGKKISVKFILTK